MLSKRHWLEYTVKHNINALYLAFQHIHRDIFTRYESTPSIYVDQLYQLIPVENRFWITIERIYRDYKRKCLPCFTTEASLYSKTTILFYDANIKNRLGYMSYDRIIEGAYIYDDIDDIKFHSSCKIIWWGIIVNGPFDSSINMYQHNSDFILHLPVFNKYKELTLAQIRREIVLPNKYGKIVIAVANK